VMNLKDNDRVSAVALVVESTDEHADAEGETGEASSDGAGPDAAQPAKAKSSRK
jgi:hypothetical protein